MFYNNFTAYSHIPEKQFIEDLIRKKYTVFIVRNDTAIERIENQGN
jgi:hypothetical protein